MLNAVWFVLGGMAVVFAALAALLAVMMGLNRWFTPKPEGKAKGGANPQPERRGHG